MEPRSGYREAMRCAWATAVLAAIVVFLFGDLLWTPEGFIASHWSGDGVKFFHPLRSFGFGELRHGNLPLWNPHSFSGAPYLGTFQMGLLYPPNVLYLWLPTAQAMNWEFALHLVLLGGTGYAWIRARGLHPLAAFYAAAMLMLAAPSFHRVVAGQLSVLDVVAWAPLLLLTCDRILVRPSLGWTLVGISAATVMILAGHPPTVMMAALAAGLYTAPRWWRGEQRANKLRAFAAIAFAPLLLSAVQLWTGLAAASEATRAGGLSYEAATNFSLPPEHLLTLLSPRLFGGIDPFWGRTFYWDATAFTGITSLVLVLYGAVWGDHALRRTALWLTVALVILALGRHAYLYALPYFVVPGFSLLRSPSKFLFDALLFAALLAAIGFDRLQRDPNTVRRAAYVAVGLALVCLSGAAGLGSLAGSSDPAFAAQGSRQMDWAVAARPGLVRSGLVAAAVAAALLAARRWRPCLWLVAAIGVAELVGFAHSDFRRTGVSFLSASPALQQIYRDAGEERVFFVGLARNFGAEVGGYDLWGYDSVHLRRYDEFIARSQGRIDASRMDNIVGWPPAVMHPLLPLLRVGRVVSGALDAPDVSQVGNPLPRFLLLREYRVVRDEREILRRLFAPGFDPRRQVILEEAPLPAPSAGRPMGRVRVLDASTDHVSLAAELPEAAILLITDAFASGWRAEALPGSDQRDYVVQRADYTLRAVPLAAGHHRLRLEYRPAAYLAGRWVSVASLGVFAVTTGIWAIRRREAPTTGPLRSRSISR
ncbi:MAG: hypothetical protein ACE5FL_00025 [Myxococcota bacterium]